jgi:hypothetical protein
VRTSPVRQLDRLLCVNNHAPTRSWNDTMELGGWLRSLGLEQYESAFRDNAVDETVLPGLTAEDLKDLGVGPIGHRRKLLDAIAALRADTRHAPLTLSARATGEVL